MKSVLLSLSFFIYFFSYSQLTPTYNDILIPMRDGKFLSADVYIPQGTSVGEVILVQTPYNKNLFSWNLPLGIGQDLDSQPYIWVIVDWRGFYGSAAAAVSSPNRGEDAYDICEWIIDQSWHGSRIGTWGPSALGKIQYDMARQQHPNHTCAVPIVAHPQFSYDDYFYGGVLEEARLEQLDALGYGLSPIVMANVYYSNTWLFAENNSWFPDEINLPTLQIGGWYDHNIDKMMEWYAACRSSSPVANEQWLLVGPWVHGGTGSAYVGSSIQGELTYPDAAFKSDSMAWDFFNYYLLDSVNNWFSTPKITYYKTGQGGWGTTDANSIAITNYDILHLSNNGQLISGTGAGMTSFVSDPSNPAPTIGGANLHPDLEQGPYDQSPLDTRNDIRTFSTSVLTGDVTISGKVICNLHVSSDQPDCDVVVHLVDEYPDGRNMLITDGVRRMRFRNGYTIGNEAFMTDGVIYPVEIELPFTHYTWKSGHRLKIYIGGNSSIRWNVNLQDGGTMYTAGTGQTAVINIHHDENYPSSIELPGNNVLLNASETASETFEVYPNPTKGMLYFSSSQSVGLIRILNTLGQIILETSHPSQIVDIRHLQPGTYFMESTVNGQRITTKIIKE